MGILNSTNAFSVRVFALLTLLGAYAVYPAYGLAPAITIALAGVVFYVLGGNPHKHGRIRRTFASVAWMVLLILGLGMTA